jgi:hypothetical protein
MAGYKPITLSLPLYIAAIQSGVGSIDTLLHGEEIYSPADIAAYSHAPVTSCDVELSFSRYKTVLADNRRRLTFENLRMISVTYCNAADEAVD